MKIASSFSNIHPVNQFHIEISALPSASQVREVGLES
jgi:hypothetical protein